MGKKVVDGRVKPGHDKPRRSTPSHPQHMP
jgi:hypothetical protein